MTACVQLDVSDAMTVFSVMDTVCYDRNKPIKFTVANNLCLMYNISQTEPVVSGL